MLRLVFPFVTLIAVAQCFASPSAWAGNRTAADSCAAKLSPVAKQIYDVTAPAIGPDSVVKDVIVERVKPLVVAGKFDRDTARANATPAGECLVLLK
ncbi:conserved exported hypothetical protein [Bradyrhizobium sp. ORS 375]|uniref:hypothetical protein n=1 Tax=Bradyrhizobium sp. (strain ORS 375) TaxID=566679 RepID=UPI00024063D7|nr:hypothetical protein [Bradyrhizobium sp. ORS 375]CCD94487.1 conserved exported hypothetical protein [Bradyrhizobium sp. ORS 375]